MTVRALVTGGVDYGEADRIVHLLTPAGAVSAFAHGAKKSKRRFAAALEPFVTIDAELTESRRKKGGLPTLTQASAVRVRLELRRDLEHIALASYIVQLAFRTAVEGDDASGQYAWTEAALEHLVAEPATHAVRRAFEIGLVRDLGYAPELSRCVACGTEPGRTWLDLSRGGLLCAEHRGQAPEVGPKTLAWLGAVLGTAEFDPLVGHPPDWAETAARKLAVPLQRFWGELLDRPLEAAGLLDTALS